MYQTTLKATIQHVTHDKLVTSMGHNVMSPRYRMDQADSDSFTESVFNPHQASQNYQIYDHLRALTGLLHTNRHDLSSLQSLASILR